MPLNGLGVETSRSLSDLECFFREKSTTSGEGLKCGYEYRVSRLRNRAGSKSTLNMSIKIFARNIKTTLRNMNIFEEIPLS